MGWPVSGRYLASRGNFEYSPVIDTPDRPPEEASRAAQVLAKVILDVVTNLPPTTEVPQAEPRERAKVIQTAAALKAAAVSGTLALPPGPWGLAVVIPDLLAVWRIQARMVADIAGVYGQSAQLSREHLVYCLFRHAAAQIVRDLTARVGERLVFRRATLRMLQTVAARLGMKVSQRAIASTAARWLPVVGSLGVAGYAYYDTAQVAATATELFAENAPFVSNDEPDNGKPSNRKACES